MRPLAELKKRAGAADFLAHRERSGLVANGLIGARSRSPLAEAYYVEVASRVRRHAARAAKDLLEPGTFFDYLARRSLRDTCGAGDPDLPLPRLTQRFVATRRRGVLP